MKEMQGDIKLGQIFNSWATQNLLKNVFCIPGIVCNSLMDLKWPCLDLQK